MAEPILSTVTGYEPGPEGWDIVSEHVNSEGERIAIAACPDHPSEEWAKALMLLVWDDPHPQGTGRCALTLLDQGSVEWLAAQLAPKEG